RLLAPGDLGGRVGRACNGGRGIERLLGSPEAGTLTVGDDVARNAEEPDAERRGAVAVLGPRSLLEPVEVREGRDERALGRILGVVVIAELVEGVAVHLGEVL